jgi:hypothetical protein
MSVESWKGTKEGSGAKGERRERVEGMGVTAEITPFWVCLELLEWRGLPFCSKGQEQPRETEKRPLPGSLELLLPEAALNHKKQPCHWLKM